MKLAALELRPTQFALGMREVRRRARDLRELGDHKLHDFLRERAVPIVRHGEWHFIIDRHHLVRACWEARVEEIVVELKADFSHLSEDGFWKAMAEARWTHLMDQFGLGPHDPKLLPEDVRGMADDPYRSLSWALRREGAYEKSETPFAEFQWADFLRARVPIEKGDEGFRQALKAAMALAKSPACRNLPGGKA